nr:immunoglobulin light chain junction region [Macaca mulatta]MPO03998.1 immunoglobulin light chain junction region [Macaca mulatta]MPO04164.1 immunoglobulin light chain junction region [Macaca mulatta]MPO04645.1 immunoglobulin light chain junction region [Macaca mulatta]MPO05027.1 immunoglobulin light chain junction region [Macaca mulatta]
CTLYMGSGIGLF